MVVQVLVVPRDLAGVGVERQGRVVVQVAVVGSADQELGRRGGDRRADVDEVQVRVVARYHPGPHVLPLLERHPTPALVARLAGGRDRAAPPQLLAGPRVVGRDHAAVRPARRHAATARDGLAVGHDRSGRLGGRVLRVLEDLRLPRQLAGHRVEREDVVVGARVDDERAVDRQVPVVLPEGVEDVVADVVGHLPAVLPAQVPGDRVDRLDDVGGVRHVHHAVVDQGRSLLPSVGHGARPDHPQFADVVPVDLIERAVAPPVERPAPHQPVLRRRGLQHLVGHRNEPGGRLRVCDGRRGRERRAHRAQSGGDERDVHRENGEGASWCRHVMTLLSPGPGWRSV